jgi:hypothetical protein
MEDTTVEIESKSNCRTVAAGVLLAVWMRLVGPSLAAFCEARGTCRPTTHERADQEYEEYGKRYSGRSG